MAKDEAKIRLRREANEQRRLRIMDARARTMGLDVEALDAQVEEKRRLKKLGQDNDDILSKTFFNWVKFIVDFFFTLKNNRQLKSNGLLLKPGRKRSK